MQKFKEKKIVIIANLIGSILAVCSLISFMFIFYHPYIFIGGVSSALLALVLMASAYYISDEYAYTYKFIPYIERKLKDAKTLKEHKSVLIEFEYLALENGVYKLPFTTTLRKIHHEITSKIELLEKQ